MTAEQCKAPGCENLTTQDICDDCDAWVTEQVARMNAKRKPIPSPSSSGGES